MYLNLYNNFLNVLFQTWIRDNDIEDCGLELFFSVDFEVLGEIKTFELKAGGGEIRVTEENKTEYLELGEKLCALKK